jgi:hypothetical protein
MQKMEVFHQITTWCHNPEELIPRSFFQFYGRFVSEFEQSFDLLLVANNQYNYKPNN